MRLCGTPTSSAGGQQGQSTGILYHKGSGTGYRLGVMIHNEFPMLALRWYHEHALVVRRRSGTVHKHGKERHYRSRGHLMAHIARCRTSKRKNNEESQPNVGRDEKSCWRNREINGKSTTDAIPSCKAVFTGMLTKLPECALYN